MVIKLESLANVLGISRERVRQINERAVQRVASKQGNVARACIRDLITRHRRRHQWLPWGAAVTVTDLRTEEALAPSLADLDGLPIRFVLGRHDERDFLPTGADMIIRNPGVPRRAPLLNAARAAGVKAGG